MLLSTSTVVNLLRRWDFLPNMEVTVRPLPQKKVIRKPTIPTVNPLDQLKETRKKKVQYREKEFVDDVDGQTKVERVLLSDDEYYPAADTKLSKVEIAYLNAVTPALDLNKCVNIKFWYAHAWGNGKRFTAADILSMKGDDRRPVQYGERRIKDAVKALKSSEQH